METYTAIELVANGDPGQAFRMKEMTKKKLAAGEVRIQVEATGINFADILCRLKLYPDAPKLPFVPGYEVVGTVIEVGKGVESLKVGNRVMSGCVFGGYASEVVVPEIYAQKIGKDTDSGVALGLVTQGITAVTLFEHSVRVYPEDLVLVQAAASGVGILLCQLALNLGCEVIGTCGSDEKVKELKKMGVQTAINYRTSDFVDEIKKKYGKRRLDVVFDSIGGSTLRRSYNMLGAGGRLASYGLAEAVGIKYPAVALAKTTLLSGLYSPLALMARSKSISGVNLLQTLKHKPYINQRMYNRTYELMKEGVLKPVVAKSFAFSEVSDAHRFVEERKAMGKVMLRWN